MTCQEVMDYMQRQLDGDLDERETEILMSHTRNCPDCAEMQERLSRLSSELENLPKVTPAYSLVDAIMPRLEQIELQRQETEPEEKPAPRRRQAPDRSGKSWFQRYRVLSGVVAAGLVAGIFMLTYNPQNMPTALEKSSAGDHTAADSSLLRTNVTVQSSNQNTAGNEEQNGVASDEPAMKSKTEESQESTVQPQQPGQSPDSEVRPEPHKADSGKESPPKKPANRVTASSPSDSPGKHGNSAPSEKELQGSEVSSGSERSGSGKNEASDESSKEAPDMAFAPPADAGAEIFNEQKSFTGTAQAQQAVSPNGLYSAEVTDKTVSIQSTDKQELLFRGGERDGVISNLVWSEDSLTLGYDVQDSGGDIFHYVIHIKDGTETKQ
ncbi:anti-sigma factor family protein [Paenibacillus pinihumi]|uniref:anti-sigma factor family protein n=1 Tax=Paenibacillus pinihumi TaxID=669462 RepID=UPI0004205781|nr:zf-HC2 domain-containing protein [Paenibacillus pinihumi]